LWATELKKKKKERKETLRVNLCHPAFKPSKAQFNLIHWCVSFVHYRFPSSTNRYRETLYPRQSNFVLPS